jgi:hypothetical protein
MIKDKKNGKITKPFPFSLQFIYYHHNFIGVIKKNVLFRMLAKLTLIAPHNNHGELVPFFSVI